MPRLFLTLLIVIIIALLIWIGRDVRRNNSFTAKDAIALLGVLLTAALALANRPPPAAPLPTVAPPATVAPTPALTLTIEGPDVAPLNQPTYFTLLSRDAVRAEWSVGGFGDGAPIVIDPLSPSYQVYVEPTNAARVGERFVLAVTAYDAAGNRVTASKPFTIIAAP